MPRVPDPSEYIHDAEQELRDGIGSLRAFTDEARPLPDSADARATVFAVARLADEIEEKLRRAEDVLADAKR